MTTQDVINKSYAWREERKEKNECVYDKFLHNQIMDSLRDEIDSNLDE